jgi:FkbM family methyltransferase
MLMGCDHLPRHPSPVTQVQTQGTEGSRAVWIPQNEIFRVRNIFEDHDYRIPPLYLPTGPLTIVDIGANVGLFALYMKKIRENCDVYCFEPVPQTVELLKMNTEDDPRIYIYPYALSNHEEMAALHLHPVNSGENSLKSAATPHMDSIQVPVKDAAGAFQRIGLNYIDILKIDTEGSEVDILESLQAYLPYVGIAMIEYHSEKDRRSIDDLLHTHVLFDAKICNPQLGIVKYINARLL